MSELAKALAAVQADLPKITKSKTANAGTYSYKYADLADVTEVVMPLLAKNGLSFSAKPTLDEDGRFVLAYSLRHTSGESDDGVYPLPSGNPQQVGSALTYARRYILSAIVGVAAEEDDDGRAAKDTRVEARPQKHWDPAEQAELREQWELEIAAAKDDTEIADIGKRLLKAKRGGDISPATYEHLAVAGGRRKAELNGKEVQSGVDVEPALPSV